MRSERQALPAGEKAAHGGARLVGVTAGELGCRRHSADEAVDKESLEPTGGGQNGWTTPGPGRAPGLFLGSPQ